MRLEYAAGERMFVDFAGDTVPVIDAEPGRTWQAHVFVSVLGARASSAAISARPWSGHRCTGCRAFRGRNSWTRSEGSSLVSTGERRVATRLRDLVAAGDLR